MWKVKKHEDRVTFLGTLATAVAKDTGFMWAVKKKKKKKYHYQNKYAENFTTKKWKFSDKKILIFFIFLLKT